jgi:anaerobic C4-dicarboxylate transporter
MFIPKTNRSIDKPRLNSQNRSSKVDHTEMASSAKATILLFLAAIMSVHVHTGTNILVVHKAPEENT